MNTLAELIPSFFVNLDIVSRELVGMIPAVTRDPRVERAAVGQEVINFMTNAAVATDIIPGVTPPDDGDQVIGNNKITITKSRRVPFRWNGEQERGLNNGGPGAAAIQGDQLQQAIRTLVNEMESDLCGLYVTMSKAYGTPGVTPFSGALSAGTDSAQLRKLLDDSGAPGSDRQLVLSTGSGAALRSHAQLQTISSTGDPNFLRQGVLIDMNGFMIRESAQIKRPASGTGALATTNAAGYAVGATVISLASAGTGTFINGDVVQFAGDSNKYTLAGGDNDVSNGGTITLAAPGLLVAMSAATKAITVLGTGMRNMAFRRSAIILAARLPALPNGGDLAVDRQTVTDPNSGISFELALYPQYRQMQYEVSAAWGVGNIKPEHTAILLGE